MADFLIEFIGEVIGGVLELVFDGASGRIAASVRSRREKKKEKERGGRRNEIE